MLKKKFLVKLNNPLKLRNIKFKKLSLGRVLNSKLKFNMSKLKQLKLINNNFNLKKEILLLKNYNLKDYNLKKNTLFFSKLGFIPAIFCKFSNLLNYSDLPYVFNLDKLNVIRYKAVFLGFSYSKNL